MTKLPGHGAEVTSSGREHLSMAGVVIASAVTWLIALGGLISTIYALPALGLDRALWLAALCTTPPLALWITRRAMEARRIRTVVPLPMLRQRSHGDLEAITDSERRSLRPIAVSAHEVAARTGELLADLMVIPSVRIFHGVRPTDSDLPPIAHAISAGRQLVFIESVAWPPGHYVTDDAGRVHCDGIYIGQSTGPLTAAIQHWRQILPRHHQVSAIVVVHAVTDGDMTLPASSHEDVLLVRAGDAIGMIRRQVRCGGKAVSKSAVAALIDATDTKKSGGRGGGAQVPARPGPALTAPVRRPST